MVIDGHTYVLTCRTDARLLPELGDNFHDPHAIVVWNIMSDVFLTVETSS